VIVAEERKSKNNSPAIKGKKKEKSGRNSQGPSAFV
jgi:hypothetical protein